MLVVVGEDVDPPIRSPLGFALGREDAGVPGARHRWLGDGARTVLGEHEGAHHIDHRDLDALPLAGLCPVVQRRGHRVGDRQPAELVGDEAGQQHRLGAHAAEQVADAAGGLDDVVVCGRIGLLAGRRVAVRPAEHDVGPNLLHGLVVQPEATQRSRPQIRDHHVARGDDVEKRLATALVLEIQGDAALVAQQVERDA